MGLFGKKKTCDVCGNEIGLLGNRKLDDGNLCKDCAKQLSPFFSERRSSTVAQIKEQLLYRKVNNEKVRDFNVTHTLGGNTKVLIDEDAQAFIVTSAPRWREVNPDIIPFEQVTGCSTDIRESRTEVYEQDGEGNSVSFDPPRYEYDYEFYLTINVNNPYFEEITFKVNDFPIGQRGFVEFREAERQSNEIRDTLTQAREDTRAAKVASNAPKTAVMCPYCGASTIPDARGCCEYCDGSLAG